MSLNSRPTGSSVSQGDLNWEHYDHNPPHSHYITECQAEEEWIPTLTRGLLFDGVRNRTMYLAIHRRTINSLGHRTARRIWVHIAKISRIKTYKVISFLQNIFHIPVENLVVQAAVGDHQSLEIPPSGFEIPIQHPTFQSSHTITSQTVG